MIVVKVRDRDIKAAPMGPVTTGSVGLPVSWHFSEEWDDLAKTAVFRVGNDGAEITVAVLEDLCLVPDELLVQANAGENLWIGVYGWKGTNANDTIVPEIAMPTIWTYTRIQDGSQPSGIEPPEGTPGWSAQIQNATDEALRVAHGVAADAAEGDFDGISPAVTISSITHGHSVTITDRDHPTGQSFNVMDGDSAYEQAVAGGYTGTEEQFNEELRSFKALSEQAASSASSAESNAEVALDAKLDVLDMLGAVEGIREDVAGDLALTSQLSGQADSSAQAAAGSAGNASTAATTATAKAGEAADSATAADGSAKDAEAYAIGKRDGTDVGSTDPAYHNNAKYYAEQASGNATAASGSATAAASSATAAGDAQTAAETAQGAAEDAQAAAEAVLASIPADYTELTEDVAELKNAFNADLVPLTWTPNITKGSYFKVADGATASSNKYARTSALWDGYGTRKAIVVDDPTYEFCLALYDETGDTSGTGYLGYNGYATGMLYIPQNAKLFGISFRRSDNATLANSDITAISAALSAFAATDTTLSVAGAPADAKATGDMFSTAIVEKDALPANTDLNTFTAIGLYRIPSGSSVIPTLVNYPSSNPGRLLVLSDENGYYCTQVVITYSNTIFTRVQTSASNHTWTDWASYDGSVVRTRSAIKNENDRYDADLTLTNGIYSFSATSVGNSDNLPSSSAGILLVFGGSAVIFQTYINRYGTVFYRIRYGQNAFSEWYRPLRPDTTLSIEGAAADAKAVGDAVRSGYVHDGDILRMSAMPEAIPVNENHMGYNEFISTTWNTLLPTGYQDGDAYNASTTKIHGVKVERASSWTSTPYGTNVDTYPIYRYIFTPQNGYDKTLFLTSGCHGNEAEAYWSLYRLVRMIYFEGHKYPTLRNLRDCRLIIIPSWNPWGFQHYRRYNAFSALNTGSTDVAKNYQAWAWLMAANHQVTVNGTVYDISQVGEANVIWQTLQDYGDSINLWLDLHTDPYAGRDTSNVDIDDPRGVTPPYGCYGFFAKDSRGYRQLFSVMYDFYNILEDEYQFTETWHPQATTPGGSSFTGWMAQFGFPGGVVEVSTFMDNFPYPSGSAGMMKLAQEYYGNCITEMLR